MEAQEFADRLRRLHDDSRFAIENLYSVFDAKRRKMVPFRFNEAQVKLQAEIEWFKNYRLPVRIVACKARRVGVSTGVEGYIYHDTSTNPNTFSLIIANQGKPSENVLEMATNFWRSTPESIGGVRLRPRLPSSYNNNPPKDRLEFIDINSKFFIASARSLDQYLGHGFQNHHATEVAYYKDGYGLFRALDPTLVDSTHSFQCLESTPNGMSGTGEFFYEQVMRANDNVRDEVVERGVTRLLFIPWQEMRLSFRSDFSDEKKRRIFVSGYTPDEKDHLKKFPLTEPEQYLWRRAMLRKPAFNNDPEIFDQEYPSDLATAFLSSGQSIFSRGAIKRYMNRVRDPVWTGDIYWGESDKSNARLSITDTVRRPRFLTKGESEMSGFASHVNSASRRSLRVYDWPVRGDRIFICGDVAGGDPNTKGGDYSVLKVGRLNDWGDGPDQVLMTWRAQLDPLAFAEVGAALAWAINRRIDDGNTQAPELCYEWNGPGVAANTYMDKYRLYTANMYYYIDYAKKGAPKSKHLGWESNAKTKPMAVNFLQRSVERDLIDEPDEMTILEMSAYQKTDSFADEGSYGGKAGTHDDCVSALQILNVRLRYAADTGKEQDVLRMDELPDDSDEDIPWDPFDEGASRAEYDAYSADSDPGTDDEDEESLFYSGSTL